MISAFCASCGKSINPKAVMCVHCGVSTQPQPQENAASTPNATVAFLIPVGRSGWAIAAGYCGLFSLIGVGAPFALLFGILGIRDIKKNPSKTGLPRCIFGIIAGYFGMLILLGIIAALRR